MCVCSLPSLSLCSVCGEMGSSILGWGKLRLMLRFFNPLTHKYSLILALLSLFPSHSMSWTSSVCFCSVVSLFFMSVCGQIACLILGCGVDPSKDWLVFSHSHSFILPLISLFTRGTRLERSPFVFVLFCLLVDAGWLHGGSTAGCDLMFGWLIFSPCHDLMNGVRSEAKQAGIIDTRENLWSYFIDKVTK